MKENERFGAMNKSPFFMVGCVRSGTTLLRDILKGHPNLICPEETQFYRWGDPFGTFRFNNLVVKDALMKKHRQIDGVDENTFEKLYNSSGSRRELYINYMEEFTQANGVKDYRWFDKSPQNVFGIPLILHDFPDAQFVHIVRNPLNVISSLLEGKVIAAPNATAAANYWNESVAIINTCKPLLGDKLYELRYEDLTDNPEEEINKLLQFLDGKPELLEFEFGNVHREKNKYKGILQENDFEIAELVCGKYAKEYKYDLATNG